MNINNSPYNTHEQQFYTENDEPNIDGTGNSLQKGIINCREN